MEKITKVTQILQREDGSEVRIVAQVMDFKDAMPGVYVHRREGPDHEWKLCNDRPDPDWMKMSVDDYITRGRSEVLQTVAPGEILRAISLLGKPMPVEGNSEAPFERPRG